MTAPEEFQAEIEAFLARQKMAPTRFGREAVGDPNFVFQVREGRMPGLRIVDRVRVFIREAGKIPSEQAA